MPWRDKKAGVVNEVPRLGGGKRTAHRKPARRGEGAPPRGSCEWGPQYFEGGGRAAPLGARGGGMPIRWSEDTGKGGPRGCGTVTADRANDRLHQEEDDSAAARQHTMSDLFISYILARNIRIEEDLVDQLFNSSEKRLARTLLLLARWQAHKPQRVLPKLSQEVLAEMVGTPLAGQFLHEQVQEAGVHRV